mgnify:CR=1 FL=1
MTDIVVVDAIEYIDTETHTLANRFTEHKTVSDAVDTGGSHYTVSPSQYEEAAANTLTTSETVVGIRRQRITVTDTRSTSEGEDDTRNMQVTEQRATSETVTAFMTSEGSETSNAVTSETVTGKLTATATDTVATAETVEAHTVAVVTDVRTTSDTVTSVRRSTATVTDTRSTSEAGSGAPIATASDATTTAESTALGFTHAEQDAAETSESVTAGRLTTQSVSDSATTSDAVTGGLHATQAVVDTAETAEAVRTSADELAGYWNNSMTTAPALWSGLPFNSMIAVNGVLYGAGAEGIYRMDASEAAKDDGAKIRSEVMWDLSDFGVPNKKRIEGVYVSGQAKGAFTVRVINERGRWDYVTRLPFNNKMAQHLAQPGRGLEASHWRIALIQTKSFGVDRVLVEHDVVGRRIG